MNIFALHLEDTMFRLYGDLVSGKYLHDRYTPFYITDPKVRHIHKATIIDRVVHQAIYRVVNPLFDPLFIYDSYSSRVGKGTHRAVERLTMFLRKESMNRNREVFALKCDIRRFFDSVDHDILVSLLHKQIDDKRALELIASIIGGFECSREKGIPLGNVTSQLFANIYLNELDQFIKHVLKVKYYIRYCDDFIIISADKDYLTGLILLIKEYLTNRLLLELHPKKITIRRWIDGIDYFGYVSFPFHRVIRTRTKKRMMRKLRECFEGFEKGTVSKRTLGSTIQSYTGILDHCDGYGLQQDIQNYTSPRRY